MATKTRRNSDQSIHAPFLSANLGDSADAETALNSSSTTSVKAHRSPDIQSHRHSLPTNAQLRSLWQDSSLKPSDDHINAGSTAHRATALRQLTGTPLRGRLRHRSVASTSSRTSLSSQPVLVRTYSPSRSRHPSKAPLQADIHRAAMGKDTKFLPADSFAFDGILRAIEPDVKETIDAIAQIYARTNLSLADEYGAHMPPQGEITGGGRSRYSRGAQRQDGNESTLSAVPEASSSSEGLSEHVGGSRKNKPSSVESGKRRKSAYVALMDVMSSSPPRDTTSHRNDEKVMKVKESSETAARASAVLPNMRIPQPGFALPSKPTTIQPRKNSLGFTTGRSSSESQVASAHATLDLSSTAIEGSSSRPSSQYEIHIGTPNSASSAWLPWLKAPKGEGSQSAEHVLKSILHRTHSDPAQDPDSFG